MKRILFKKIPVALLLSVVTGALFFCTFSVAMSASNGIHDAATKQEMPVSHFFHIRELTLSATAQTSLALSILVLVVVFSGFPAVCKIGFFLRFPLFNYLRKKFYEIFHVVQQAQCRWLSLLERSPNFS